MKIESFFFTFWSQTSVLGSIWNFRKDLNELQNEHHQWERHRSCTGYRDRIGTVFCIAELFQWLWVNYIPYERKICGGLTREDPPLPPHTWSFSSVYVFQECSICLSVPVLSVSSGFFALLIAIPFFFKLHRSVFLHWWHHNNFSPFFVHSSSLPPSSQPSTLMPLYQPPSSGSPLSLPTAMLFSPLHGGCI